ncbi:MAG: arylsulfatase [Planctomycetota bacterium]|nr:arylsulfatase [Planctomycetota bacterium]
MPSPQRANGWSRRAFLKAGVAGAALAAACPRELFAGPAARPNVIVILADDLGLGDVSCFAPQTKTPTPHVDRIAREGIAFTDAHSSSAVCTPTRYGILTGRYPWRTRLVKGVLGNYAEPLIEKERLTLPGLLKRVGYKTACFGKWHFGWDWPPGKDKDFTKPIEGGPTARGFDYYFGVDDPKRPPYCFIENNRTVGLPTEQRPDDAPNGASAGPMLPGWKFDEMLPTITDKAVAWIDEQARAKQPFFIYFPLTSPHRPIAPSKEFAGKSGHGPLADFILETDAVAGRLMAALERNGVARNTLLIFTSDNGAAGQGRGAGFKGGKHGIYEGGHRVPFVARWPERIAPGGKSEEILCLNDLFATCAAIVEAKLPADCGEDSVNMLPALLNERRAAPLREAIVHQAASGQLAIRQGPWKYVEAFEGRQGGPEQLFNLAEDPAEDRNVLASQRETAARLAGLLDKYRREERSRP